MLCDNLENLLSPILSRFVSIYVNIPETKIINNKNYIAVNKIYDKFLELINQNSNLIDFFNLAKEANDKCICIEDLIYKFRNHENYPLFQLMYDKIRTNYNSDVLVYFYFFTLFRKNKEIEIYELY